MDQNICCICLEETKQYDKIFLPCKHFRRFDIIYKSKCFYLGRFNQFRIYYIYLF